MQAKWLLWLVVALLVLPCTARGEDKVKQLLIIGDKPDGHPPTTHEFMAGTRVMAELLKGFDGLDVKVVDGREPFTEGHEYIANADGVVLFISEGGKWAQADPRRYDALTRVAARGGGITALHWGIGAKDAKYTPDFQKLIGGIHGGPDRKYKKLTTTLSPVVDHPIARGIKPFEINDEFYYRLKFADQGRVQPVVQAKIDDKPQTVAWAWERPDGGRSFGFSGLHFHENWQREEYRRLVAQGILWSMKFDIPAKGFDVTIDENTLRLE